MTKRIVFPREVLLVEVERRCGFPACGARTRLSMTKEEARAYTGFDCALCGRHWRDALSEQDIPEWWGELNVASLEGSKPPREAGREVEVKRTVKAVRAVEVKRAAGVARGAGAEVEREAEADEAEVVARMSEAWRRIGGEREAAPEDAEAERGGSF